MSYFDNANDYSFGIVTVMDIKIYKYNESLETTATSPADYLSKLDEKDSLGEIKHLQIATLSTDGPSITIQGGKYNNALLKYGKTARCEMTDALAQPKALVALGGAMLDPVTGDLSITDKFGAPVTLVGDTFVVDQKTGKHVPVKILMYQFLPDSTPSFAFDSGNAATFDLNGDLLAVELGATAATSGDECPDAMGYFFSLIPFNCLVEK